MSPNATYQTAIIEQTMHRKCDHSVLIPYPMGKDAHSVIDKKSLKVEQKEWLTLKPAVYWGWCAILEREFAGGDQF